MSTSPTLSLVVLYYEQPKELERLRKTLEGLIGGPDEIIFVDDHSTAAPLPKTAEGWAGPRTQIIRTPQNLGPVGAMNTGLQAAQGDYVHFLACDDTVDTHFYDVARKNLTPDPQAGLYSTNTRITDASAQDLGVQALPQPAHTATFLPPRAAHDALYNEGSWFAGNATLFAAAALRELGGFDESLEEFADAFACYVLACHRGAFFEPRALAVKHDPVSGRNMAIYQDPQKSGQICDLVIRKFSRDYSQDFSSSFVRRFKNRWRYNERALRFFASNEGLAGNAKLSVFEMLAVATLFLIYRPGEFPRKLRTKFGPPHRPQL